MDAIAFTISSTMLTNKKTVYQLSAMIDT